MNRGVQASSVLTSERSGTRPGPLVCLEHHSKTTRRRLEDGSKATRRRLASMNSSDDRSSVIVSAASKALSAISRLGAEYASSPPPHASVWSTVTEIVKRSGCLDRRIFRGWGGDSQSSDFGVGEAAQSGAETRAVRRITLGADQRRPEPRPSPPQKQVPARTSERRTCSGRGAAATWFHRARSRVLPGYAFYSTCPRS